MHNSIHDIKVFSANNWIVWEDKGPQHFTDGYIDFTSGIFAVNIGHGNPYVEERLVNQVKKLVHSYQYNTEIRTRYLQALKDFTGFEAAYLFSAGTEAVEAAWRVATRFSNRPGAWGLQGGFHGKTLGARMIAMAEKDWRNQTPLDKTAAIFFEPYNPLTAEFHPDKVINKLKTLQKENGIMLVADEIQAGFGRTGKLFGYQHYPGLKPDIVCIGKGMGNGFPVSGLLGPAEMIDNPVMDLSSTNGGNPLACAAGLAVIEYMREHDVIEQAKRKGDLLQEVLRGFPCKTAGRGMVAALALESVDAADRVVLACRDKGLLVVHTRAHTVKLGPPLTISDENLEKGLEILRKVVEDVS